MKKTLRNHRSFSSMRYENHTVNIKGKTHISSSENRLEIKAKLEGKNPGSYRKWLKRRKKWGQINNGCEVSLMKVWVLAQVTILGRLSRLFSPTYIVLTLPGALQIVVLHLILMKSLLESLLTPLNGCLFFLAKFTSAESSFIWTNRMRITSVCPTLDYTFFLWCLLSASVPEKRGTSSPFPLPQCCYVEGQDGRGVLTYLLLRTHQKHGGLRCYWTCLIWYVFIYIEFFLYMISPTLHPYGRKSSSETFSDLPQSDWGDSQIFKN